MGNEIYDRLSLAYTRRFVGDAFKDSSDDELFLLKQEADIMAQAEHMTLSEALKIISGQTRLPYGTARSPETP
jgi:hypothetical protein